MSDLILDIENDTADGRVKATGTLTLTPTAMRVDGTTLVLPAPIVARLKKNEVTTLGHVDPTPDDLSWLYAADESALTGGALHLRYFAKKAESENYSELVEYDASMLEPLDPATTTGQAIADLQEQVDSIPSVDPGQFATAAQGAKADSAVQPAALADVEAKADAAAAALDSSSASGGDFQVADGSGGTEFQSPAALGLAKGVAGGVAPLDGDAKLPEAQVPDRLSEASLNGTFDTIPDAAARAAMNAALAARVAEWLPQMRAPFTGVFITANTSAAVSGERDYILWHGIGGGRFTGWSLTCKDDKPGSYALNQLSRCAVSLAMLSVSEDDDEVTLTGTWLLGNSASAYSDTYRRAETSSDSAEFVTPVGAECLGVRVVLANNGGGLAVVDIDGDATAAHLLPTAQDVVDAGEFASTILVANGGTVNPTDRVLVTYQSTGLNYDVMVPIASGLAAEEHTVTLSVTGYQRIGSVGARVYVGGFMYGSNDTLPTTTDVDMVAAYSVQSEDPWESAWEYADQMKPRSSGTLTFVGNIHGYDEQTGLTVRLGYNETDTNMAVDGAVQTGPGDFITVTRTSTLHHPAGDDLATAVVTYLLDRDGLTVTSRITYAADVQIGRAHMMFPTNGATEPDAFDRVEFSDGRVVTLPGTSDTTYGQSRSGAARMWQSDGDVAVLGWLPDVWGATDGWSRNLPNVTNVQDRDGELTKLYMSWLGSRGPYDIDSGFTKERTMRYLVAVLDGGAEAALA